MLRPRSEKSEARAREILARLPRHFEIKNGELAHLTDQSEAVRAALADQILPPTDLKGTEFRDCVRLASRSLLEKEDFTLPTFLSELTTEVNDLRKKPGFKFTMWSKFNFVPKRRITKTVGKTAVNIAPQLPRRMRSGYRDPRESDSTIPKMPERGGYIYCSGIFRSEISAGYTLSDEIEKFIAVANFRQNFSTTMMFPESSRAFFRSGPTFILFSEETSSYFDSYWSNPEFGALPWRMPPDGEERLAHALRYCGILRRASDRNPLTTTALRCMQLLNNGWESADDQRWVMLVWACFEKLFSDAGTRAQTRTETIVARAAKLDADPLLRSSLLFALAEHRNDAAHANQSPIVTGLAHPLAAECTNYLIWLLRWCLANGRRFKSREEFIQFVDLPKEVDRLRQREKLNKLALSFWDRPKELE